MRFLLPTLMRDEGIKNAYQLHKRSKGAINTTTAQRLVSAGERPVRLDLRILDILCEMFDVEVQDLLKRERPAGDHPKKSPRR